MRNFIPAAIVILTTAVASTGALAQLDKGAMREAACRDESKNATEYEICIDRNLTRLDAQLNETYQAVRKGLPSSNRSNLRRVQLKWINARNRCGKNYRCIEQLYKSRQAELEQMEFELSGRAKATAISCAGEGKYRSQASLEATTITFENRGENDEVSYRICWLDFNGKRKFYKHIFPNDRLVQQTFLSHPWLITSPVPGGGEDCIQIYWPTKKPRTITLD